MESGFGTERRAPPLEIAITVHRTGDSPVPQSIIAGIETGFSGSLVRSFTLVEINTYRRSAISSKGICRPDRRYGVQGARTIKKTARRGFCRPGATVRCRDSRRPNRPSANDPYRPSVSKNNSRSSYLWQLLAEHVFTLHAAARPVFEQVPGGQTPGFVQPPLLCAPPPPPYWQVVLPGATWIQSADAGVAWNANAPANNSPITVT